MLQNIRALQFLAAFCLLAGMAVSAFAAPVAEGAIVGTFGTNESIPVSATAIFGPSGESVRAVGVAKIPTALTPMMAGADRTSSIECMAAAIAYEAGNESQAGKQAVAQVVLNRAHHPAFPKSVCSVIYQGSGRRTGCQFTFTCDGSLRRILSRRVLASARAVAVAAIDGELPPTVGQATHYHADYVSPRWAPAMARIGQIGAHIFYAFPGRGGTQGGFVPGSVADRSPMHAPSKRQGPPAFTAWGLVPAAPSTMADSSVSKAY